MHALYIVKMYQYEGGSVEYVQSAGFATMQEEKTEETNIFWQ